VRSTTRIVLVRPRNPLNIGASARAMANFGFSDLWVVKPYAPVWRETVSAPGAEPLVRSAQVAASLDEAVKDRELVLGTTALRNRTVRRPAVRLPDLAAFLRRRRGARRVAVLFGSEKTGLSNRYLERCHALLVIPTDPSTPSMNLSQAVAVVCYELGTSSPFRATGPARRAVERESDEAPASRGDVRRLVRQTLDLCEATGYLKHLPAGDREEKIWRTFLRWNIRRSDLAVAYGVLRHALKGLRPGIAESTADAPSAHRRGGR
jgi:tRNA/rRNA methyltransferase